MKHHWPSFKTFVCPRFFLNCFLISFLILWHSIAQAQIHGGLGPSAVRAAWNLAPGAMTFATQTRLYVKTIQNFTRGEEISQLSIRNMNMAAALNWGITDRFEAAIIPVIYRSVLTNRFNLPDDLFLAFKIGAAKRSEDPLNFAFEFGARLPLAQNHNLPLENYSTGRISFGATGIASFAKNPDDPLNSMNFHFNLGYWNYNDAGVLFSDEMAALEDGDIKRLSQEFSYAFAAIFPHHGYDFRLQFFGRGFISTPQATAYAREPVAYFSPGLGFEALSWLSLELNLDFRVSGDKDITRYGDIPRLPQGIPNYPSWQFRFGAKAAIFPSSLYARDPHRLFIQNAGSRKKLFEEILEEKEETQSAVNELENIKAKRLQSEKEIERLRSFLKENDHEDLIDEKKNVHENENQEKD